MGLEERGNSRDKTRARANTQTQRQRYIGEAPSRASGTARGLMPQSTLSSKLQTSSSVASWASHPSTHSPRPVLPYYLPQCPLPSPLLQHLAPGHGFGLVPHSNQSSAQPPPSNTSCSPIRGRHPHPPLNHCSRILVSGFLAPRPVLPLPKGTS